ncbi:MAG: hypothetical protein QOG76_1187 [Pseudonocardiales bacterium]|nr:hypothetical protein [Pseudonocardiales bacterium]
MNGMNPSYSDDPAVALALGELVPDDLDVAGLSPELFDALAANRIELANTELPAPPPDLVGRWDAALAELPPLVPTGQLAPVHRLTDRRSTRWAAGLVLAAAAAAAVLVAVPGTTAAPVPATPPPAGQLEQAGPLALTSKDLPMGGQDYGPLGDPARRAGCLAHVGAPGATVLGARQVNWAGRPGVLLVLPTGEPGRLRALVVSPDCGPGRGEVLADTPVGR